MCDLSTNFLVMYFVQCSVQSLHPYNCLLINNNNNNHDDIYSASIKTKVIVRVHSVHLVNLEQRQAATDPQTKPPDLAC